MVNIFKIKFVLYSYNLDGIKEYEEVNGEYIKLKDPIKFKMFGVYKHSFSCSLQHALKDWKCLLQILKFQRFYHSCVKESYIKSGTQFNISLLPIVYLYSLIDTKMFHKIYFILN